MKKAVERFRKIESNLLINGATLFLNLQQM